MYNCMFVSALPDPTCNSEKSANGGNKQILLFIIIIIITPAPCPPPPLPSPPWVSGWRRITFQTTHQSAVQY